MQIGLVGLGKMGQNMALRLLEQGHEVVGLDRHAHNREMISQHKGLGVLTLPDLVGALDASKPKIVWLMVRAGETTDQLLKELSLYLNKNDILIDGGNSDYRHDSKREAFLKEKGIYYLDVGTSGGIWGRQNGYCLMVGGNPHAYLHCEPIFRALAPLKGYLYCGESGSGHYVKMIHNAIEYGMMQALGEGFHLLKKAPFKELDLKAISNVWQHGSVVRSWLLELLALALEKDPNLEAYEGKVGDSGEGRWSLEAAISLGVPAPVLAQALFARFRSQEKSNFSDQLLSALRDQFGGHKESP